MPPGFTTWTVLNNQPIDKLEANLWHVSGKMSKGNERKMIVGRRSDGDLVIFNAIALDEPGMAELEAFGRIAYMVVPNGFHRQDAFIWKQRYPKLKVVAPRGAKSAVEKAVGVDLTCDEVPPDAEVQVLHPAGLGDKEALMVVQHGGRSTLTTCDALLNVTSETAKFPFSFLLGPIDRPSTPRLIRWMMLKDKRAWVAHLEQLAQTTTRVIPGHGAILPDGPAALRAVAALLK